MRSRTSLFNATLFKKTIVRFWPVWFLYAFVWLLAFPAGIGGALMRSLRMEDPAAAVLYVIAGRPLDAATSAWVPVFVFGACCVTAMAVFSHLYSSRAAAAYGALPIRREAAFCSLALAGLLPLLAANVLVAAAALAAEALCGELLLWPIMTWLGAVSLECVAFFGICAFCAQLTGNLVVLPLLAAAVNVAAWFAEGVVTGLLTTFVYGYSHEGGGVVSLLSPITGLRRSLVSLPVYEADADGLSRLTGYEFQGWTAALAYAAAGLVLLVLALLLYRRRRLETAGDAVAVAWLKPIFKYLLSVAGAFGLGYLLFGIVSSTVRYGTAAYAAQLAIFMCVGAFIGYFAAEMLIKKSFQVFSGARRYIGFAAVCLCSALFVVACETGFFGYETRIPARGEVAAVSVDTSYGGNPARFTSGGGIDQAMELHSALIANQDGHERDMNDYNAGALSPSPATATTQVSASDLAYGGAEDDPWADPLSRVGVRFEYELTDGGKLVRYYDLAARGESRDIRALEELLNTQEGIETRNATDFPVTLENITYASVNSGYYPLNDGNYSVELTAWDAHELYYDCILPDMAEGTIGAVGLIEDEKYSRRQYDCSIYIDCYERLRTPGAEERFQSFYIDLSRDSTRTLNWLHEHGIYPMSVRRAYEAAQAEN